MTELPPGRESLRSALDIVRAQQIPPTPTIRWPLLEQRLGATVFVKHENHTALGAFAAGRRGLPARAAAARTRRARRDQRHARQPRPVDRARRGTPFLSATIVVPHGNSVEKNAAMRALGATLVEHGEDFQQAREHAAALAESLGLAHGAQLPPRPGARRRQLLDRVLRTGAARHRAGADRPGFGHLRLRGGARVTGATSRIVGVVSAHATAYKDSFAAGRGGRGAGEHAPGRRHGFAARRTRKRWPSSGMRWTRSSR